MSLNTAEIASIQEAKYFGNWWGLVDKDGNRRF